MPGDAVPVAPARTAEGFVALVLKAPEHPFLNFSIFKFAVVHKLRYGQLKR